jgi:hypothetical protein
MNTILFRSGLASFAAVALLVAAPAAFAQTQTLKATLTAKSQVPPNASTGTGTLAGTYDPATKKLVWTVTYTGLSGPPTAAHFHGPAAAGANAGVVVPQKDGLASPMKGEATLTDAQAADLAAGMWYFNIHTDANKGGEIRGQVTK